MHGTGGFAHTRPQRSQEVMIQRSPPAERTAAHGLRSSLLSLVWVLNPEACFNNTHICVRRPVKSIFVTFLSHSSISTSRSRAPIDAPKMMPFGSNR